MTKSGRIELMSPAGDFTSLQAAIDNGADSVYFGVEQLNMRARASMNFTIDDLPEISRRCKEKGVRTYLTLNTIIYDHDLSIIKTLLDKAKEADLLAEARMRRSIAMNQFLPEERLGNLNPLYRRSHTPEEQKRTGRWFSYYDDPNFTREPLPFKKGGFLEEIIIGSDNPASGYIGGTDGGQDDTIRADLPNNSYIVNASSLSDAGDGNSLAGAEKIKALVSSGEYYISPEDVARYGKIGAKKLDHLFKNLSKHKRGGKTTLPPKAKPLSSYVK